MPRGGRWRLVPVSRWSAPDYQALTPHAKLVLLALTTGSLSNLAGIGFYYPEALARDTGLGLAAVEEAMGELEKRPTPARSFVVRDLGVVWVRDQLRLDPARESDPEIKNQKHRTAIETILAALPRDSVVVKKFRDSYRFRLHTPSSRASHGASHGASEGPSHVPDTGLRITESGLTDERVSDGPPGRPEGPAAQKEPGENEGEAITSAAEAARAVRAMLKRLGSRPCSRKTTRGSRPGRAR